MNLTPVEYRFGCYRVVDGGRALLRDGQSVAISPRVLGVLVELLRVPGRVVSKAELLETVWAGTFVEEGNLTQSVSVLRKLLAPDFPDSPIETLPRIGYRFRAPVEMLQPQPIVPSAAAQPPDPRPLQPVVPPPGVTGLSARWALVLALTAAVSIAAALLISLRLHRRVLAGNRHAHRRVAVLAFRDLSHAPDTAWLRTAFQETVSTDLSANSDLEIVPADDVDRAERELGMTGEPGLGANTLRRLCDDLDCDDVVTGSYLATGGSIRLDTTLLSARDGSALGTDSQTQPLDHLLPLIAANSQALRRQFGLPASISGDAQGTISADPEAFALYAKGLDQMRLYDGPAALKFFQRSIAADPKFPLAHMAYSSALTITGQEQRAAQEARIAQSLSGNLSRRQQLIIEARAEQTAHQYDQAASTFQTLSQFYPDDIEYVWMRAAMLDYGGHTSDAIAQLLPLLTSKPRSGGSEFSPAAARDPRLYSELADAYSVAGDWPASLLWAQRGEEEARRRGATVLYERLLTTESQAEFYLHQLPVAEARTQEALQLSRQFGDRSGELRALNRLGQIDTAEGKLPEARTMLQQALALETAAGEIQRQIHTLSALGQNLARSGNHVEAMATFQRELKLAQPFNQPDTTLGAELDVAREEALSGRRKQGRVQLDSVLRKAQILGDREVETEATAAIRQSSS